MKILTVIAVIASALLIANRFFVYAIQLRTVREPMTAIFENYEQLWRETDSLENMGLTRSALDKVNSIYALAVKSDNAPQVYKSLVYMVKYRQILEEGDFARVLEAFESEISKSQFPVRNILQSAAAELYWGYYQQNRWRFSDRTQTKLPSDASIETWDLRRITEHAKALYKASLENTDSLQETGIEAFTALLQAGNMPVHYRPTLYDFLAHRAIDFLMDEEAYITLPSYAFTISGEEVFKPAEDFIKLPLQNRDTTSGKWMALKIMQQLIAFHLHDSYPEALADVELKRFRLLRMHSVEVWKDSLYVQGLKQLEQRFSGDSAGAAISFNLAQFYSQRGSGYDPQSGEDFRYDKRTALEYCDKVIAAFPASTAARNCSALRKEIKANQLSFTVEEVNMPGKPFRGLVEYKNTGIVYFRIIADNYLQQLKSPAQDDDDVIKNYLRQPVLQSWSQNLPDPGDYQMHAAEIKMPALQAGYYLVLASVAENFSLSDHGITWTAFAVSELSYVSKKNEDGYSFYILNRASGKPVPGANARIFINQYNNSSRTYELKESGSYQADRHGYMKIPASGNSQNILLEISKGDDTLKAADYFDFYPGRQEERPGIRTIFFTDRSIYRPGQTIYFKGIVMEQAGDKHSLKAGFKSQVEFRDVNGQRIQTLELETNSFGSFHGSFTAPSDGLLGEMMISHGSGSVSISVEEYKRPKFEVVFDTVKGSWRFNEFVSVRGTAKSYAGSQVDGAQVTYRVIRKARLPVWYYGAKHRGFEHFSREMEIAGGMVTTDENGAFTIRFKAIPESKIPAADRPQFDYVVIADVTDITSETRSGEKTVTIGYTAVDINIDITESISVEALSEIKITSFNLSGVPESSSGTITVYSLSAPDRIFRPRLWKRPDQFVMSKEAYHKLFPEDLYDREDDFTRWEKKTAAAPIPFAISGTGTVSLPGLSQGKYHLQLKSTDKFGAEIVTDKYFTVYVPHEKKVPAHETLWHSAIPDVSVTGSEINFEIGTAEKDLNILYEVKSKNYNDSRMITLKKGRQTFTIPVTAQLAGGMSVSIMAIKHGRVYNSEAGIAIPFTDKELKISFETFRDRLQPGQQEEWRLKISGSNGSGVAAEMVASLYDASLDQFRPHDWYFDLHQRYYAVSGWNPGNCFGVAQHYYAHPDEEPAAHYFFPAYDQLNWFGLDFAPRYLMRNGMETAMQLSDAGSFEEREVKSNLKAANNKTEDAAGSDSGRASAGPEAVAVRKNLQETAFFFPQLQTDSAGSVIIRFTVPEALTRWKLLGFAHTADLSYGMVRQETVTAKELMIFPNAPRFMREGDQMVFAAKVTNLTGQALTGTATLQLFDALTMKPVDAAFANSNRQQSFSAAAGQSAPLAWPIEIPEAFDAILYRVTATAGNQSDGEENMLPVLSNRMLVTESMPLNVSGNETRNFTFGKLLQSGNSATLKNLRLTLEFTSNPAWYAIQALPYLMEYPYQCSEQTFNRYYAHALSAYIANSDPAIKQVFDQWKLHGQDALLSNLQKNSELKSLLLEETPWLMQANDESERKKRIALLFDLNRLNNESRSALRKLKEMQTSNGGWSWFAGGPDDRYITQYITAGFGRLMHLNVISKESHEVMEMVNSSVEYLDKRVKEDYELMLKSKVNPDQDNLSFLIAHYLYARSFFLDIPVPEANQVAFNYYLKQAKQYWTRHGIYLQGMLAVALDRYGDDETPSAILRSLKENAINHQELGMYWKSNVRGYFWYQSPVEVQSLLIEAFDEAGDDKVSIAGMKTWLLKQKQTQDWSTTKATADAVYALLLQGGNWLTGAPEITVVMGQSRIEPADDSEEAGTGYFSKSWQPESITPQMGTIKVTRKGSDEGISWITVYWQYFEQLDQITPSSTPLSLRKEMFLQRNSDTGPVLEPIGSTTVLKPGDLVKVRIELRVDRDMEYIHMKDLRAACFEPLNVLSGYYWQDGLGYYEETRDAATHFFFDHLRKGTYVFEYPLRAQLKGDFSNGITSIQCMYAPEFRSHSEGIRIRVQ